MLESEIDGYRRYRQPLSVAMIDIDHFKWVNDSHGHDAGDKVLSALANLLNQGLRTNDRVGRIGGEEFAVIFPNTDIDVARLACDRLLTAIRSAEIEVAAAKISVTVSIGLTKANPTAENSACISKRADKLLYNAKSHGRNRMQLDMCHVKPHQIEEGHVTSPSSAQ